MEALTIADSSSAEIENCLLLCVVVLLQNNSHLCMKDLHFHESRLNSFCSNILSILYLFLFKNEWRIYSWGGFCKDPYIRRGDCL